MTQIDELQQTVRAIRETRERLASLDRQLQPYWSRREQINLAIIKTHDHQLFKVRNFQGETIEAFLSVARFRFDGAARRKPLWSALDELSAEYGPTRTEHINTRNDLKALERIAEHIRKSIEKEQKKRHRYWKRASSEQPDSPPEQPSEKHRCAQCNSEPDGTEKLIRGVWLHAECARFYTFRN